MKKHHIIYIAVILFLASIISIGIGLGILRNSNYWEGWNEDIFIEYEKEWKTDTKAPFYAAITRTYTADDFDAIKIRTSSADIRTAPASTETIQLRIYSRSQGKDPMRYITIRTSNRSLILEENRTRSGWRNRWQYHVELTLPTAYQQDIHLNTASGDIELQDIQLYTIRIQTVSGNIHIETAQAHTTDIHSVSGDIQAENIMTQTLMIKQVSGDAAVERAFVEDSVILDTVSGNMKTAFLKPGKRIDSESVSGDIHLILPEEAGAAITFQSVSGDFYGKDMDSYESRKKTIHAQKQGISLVVIEASSVSGNLHLQ